MRRVAVSLIVVLTAAVCPADEAEQSAVTISVGEPAKVKGPNALVRSVAFSPDGKRLAAGESDRTLWLFETATRKRLGSVVLPPGKG